MAVAPTRLRCAGNIPERAVQRGLRFISKAAADAVSLTASVIQSDAMQIQVTNIHLPLQRHCHRCLSAKAPLRRETTNRILRRFDALSAAVIGAMRPRELRSVLATQSFARRRSPRRQGLTAAGFTENVSGITAVNRDGRGTRRFLYGIVAYLAFAVVIVTPSASLMV
jgi:hypothetical protein